MLTFGFIATLRRFELMLEPYTRKGLMWPKLQCLLAQSSSERRQKIP